METNTALVRFEAARRALAEARSIDEVKDIRDKAEALRLYVKQQGESLEMQNDVAEIKLRAERRAGELLVEMKTNGERHSPGGDTTSLMASRRKTLSDIGVSVNQSSNWQRIAAMPEETFERTIAETKANGDELTSAGMLRVAKEQQREQRRQERQQAADQITIDPPETYNIYHGDVNTLHNQLENNSVDLFFTDPPYHANKPYLFADLARLAADKLKDGGLLLTYSGQMHLMDVLHGMSDHLDYWWLFAVRHTGGHLTIWNRQLWNDWKPVLVFSKQGQTPKAPEWVQDFIDGGGRDKTYHNWGQDANEATYWIEKLTDPGALVCDPFVGGGAIPIACYLTRRHWVGTDISQETITIARQRIAKVIHDS